MEFCVTIGKRRKRRQGVQIKQMLKFNKTNIISIIFITIALLVFTNKIWLERKAVEVNFDILGKNTIQAQVFLDEKENIAKVDLNKDSHVYFPINKSCAFKNAKFVFNRVDKPLKPFTLKNIDLRNGKIKLDNLDNFQISGAKSAIQNNSLIITPTSDEVILNYPIKARPAKIFHTELFLIFLLLPSLIFIFKNKILNTITHKTFVFACLFAVVFTCLTPHWYVKQDYWLNKYTLPKREGYYIKANNVGDFKNIGFKNNDEKIAKGSFYILGTEDNGLNFMQNKFTLPKKYLNMEMSITPLKDINFTFTVPWNVSVKNLKINNKITPMIDNSADFSAKKLEPVNISFDAKLKTNSEISLLQNINKIAFFITLLIYFLLFKALNYIYQHKNLKTICQSNSSLIYCGALLFLFLILFNSCEAYNTNYFANFNILLGDSNLGISTILESTLLYTHPYYSLAFLPFFDILFFLTKNLILSLIIIYSAITTISVLFLYKSLSLINEKYKLLNIILTLTYFFSYSVLLSNYTFTAYAIFPFYLSILMYMLITSVKNNSFSIRKILLFSLILGLSYGVTRACVFYLIALLLPVFIIKRLNPKKILLFIVSTASMIYGLLSFKKLVTPIWGSVDGIVSYWLHISNNTKLFIDNTLKLPLLAQSTNYSNLLISLLLIFILLIVVFAIFNTKSKKIQLDDKIIFYSVLFVLLANFVSLYFWDPAEGLLFAPNHLILWAVLIGFSFKFIEFNLNEIIKKCIIYLFLAFLIIQIPTNIIAAKEKYALTMKNNPYTFQLFEEAKDE